MTQTKQELNRKWLEKKYIDQDMRKLDIALKAGVNKKVIEEKIKEYDLEKEKYPHQSESWLRKKVEREENIRDIAKEADVDVDVIELWMEKHSIDYKDKIYDDYQDKELLKEKFVDEGKDVTELSNEFGVSKEKIIEELKRHDLKKKKYPYRYKDWLQEKYIEEQLTPTQIADEVGMKRGTIVKWLKKHGFETYSKYDQDKKFDFGNTSKGAAIVMSDVVKEEIEDIGKDEWSSNDVVGLLVRHFGNKVKEIIKDIKLGQYEDRWMGSDGEYLSESQSQ